jgi:hypothetical protein
MDETLRQLVWDRARGVCEYCHMSERLDILPFQIDHVIAQKHHGPTTAENLALCCYSDNSYKGPNIAGIDPLTGEVTRLFHPRRDAWGEHFRWDGPGMVGLTAIGRATIDVLAINLPKRVEHRRLLLAAGVWSG